MSRAGTWEQDIRIDRNVAVPMRDGAILRCDIWWPDAGKSHPVLMQRTPYGKELAALDARVGYYCTQHLVAAGYAVVFQDTRGRFDSEGAWGGLTPRAWRLEAHDTYDTVEWAAGQPWCDGGVGLFGASYPGALCWLGAGEQPPHLRAIAPMMIGGHEDAHLGSGGPRDQARLADRSDVLAYQTAALTEPLNLTGQTTVHLYAASSAVDTDFVAKLVDIHSNGNELLILSGLACARYRKGTDQEVPLEPGTIEKYEINLGPIAVRIPAGHRIGLYLCSSDFPWYDRNMNTGNALGADADPVVAEQTVFHDPAYPSRLDIPVLAHNR